MADAQVTVEQLKNYNIYELYSILDESIEEICQSQLTIYLIKEELKSRIEK